MYPGLHRQLVLDQLIVNGSNFDFFSQSFTVFSSCCASSQSISSTSRSDFVLYTACCVCVVTGISLSLIVLNRLPRSELTLLNPGFLAPWGFARFFSVLSKCCKARWVK